LSVLWYFILCSRLLSLQLGKKMYTLFGQTRVASDVRIKLINELVNAIRIVKYYVWETHFLHNIAVSREKELKVLLTSFRWAGSLFFTLASAPAFAMALTFLFYGLRYPSPDIAVLLTTVNLLGLLRVVFFMLPTLFSALAQI